MKKLLAFLLAVLMIVSCLFVLSSCKDDETDENGTTDNTSDDATAEKTWGGRTLTFLTRGPYYTYWESFDIYAEAENGDRINDAVYTRNSNIEAKYDVKIAEIKGGATLKADAYNQISSGAADFDVIVLSAAENTYLAQSNQLLDLNTIEYLNLEESWWDQNANEGLSIGDALYFTCSDLTFSDLDGTWFLTFNKKILEDNQLENPYQLVYDDEWTWDKYLEMARLGSKDLNGDNRQDENDQYGISTESFDTFAMFYGAGCSITSKDEDNYPEISVYNDYIVQVVEKLVEMVNDKETYTKAIGVFAFAENGQALFGPTTVRTMRINYNEMKDDFGVLPVPKFNEDQDRYYHIVSLKSTGSTVSIPKTTTDYEFVGTILDALTEESSKVLIPAYYDEILENRYLRDEESRDMLEIIFASRVFDLGFIYDWGGFYNYLSGIKAGSANDFASQYDSKIDLALSQMEETVDAYKDIG